VLLAGRNNAWNFSEMSLLEHPFYYKYFYQLKLYRFFKIIETRLSHLFKKIKKKPSYVINEKTLANSFCEKESCFLRDPDNFGFIPNDELEPEQWKALFKQYFLDCKHYPLWRAKISEIMGNNIQAKKFYLEAIKTSPELIHPYVRLAWFEIDRGDLELAFKYLVRAVENQSQNRFVYSMFLWGYIEAVNQNHPIVKKMRKFLLEYESYQQAYLVGSPRLNLEKDPLLSRFIDFGFRQLEIDILEMKKLSKKNGAKFVLTNYPNSNYFRENKEIAKISKKHKIPFINCRLDQNQSILKNQNFDFFLKDGHCSSMGYEAMAKIIKTKILKFL